MVQLTKIQGKVENKNLLIRDSAITRNQDIVLFWKDQVIIIIVLNIMLM